MLREYSTNFSDLLATAAMVCLCLTGDDEVVLSVARYVVLQSCTSRLAPDNCLSSCDRAWQMTHLPCGLNGSLSDEHACSSALYNGIY